MGNWLITAKLMKNIVVLFSMNSNLLDGINFLSKFTPLRGLNALQVLTSYFFSKWTKKPHQWGLPLSISVEPTTSCNLRCPECPSGLRSFTRPTGMISLDLYQKALDQLAPSLWYVLLYFQGEPYLHPHFHELVKRSVKKKLYTATSTNGHFLSSENARKTVESGLDRLIISIDGTTQDTYESYRIGGRLDRVIEGTKAVVQWKRKLKSKTPHIIFQFLVVKPNEHQIEEVQSLAKELGVDEVGFKTAQIYDYEDGSPLIPENDKYSRYRDLGNGKYVIKNQLLNHCWKMWHSCVITWNGQVVPCCFDKDAHYPLGDMKDQTFNELWFGPSYVNFRSQLIKARDQIEMCRNCTEGTRVWA